MHVFLLIRVELSMVVTQKSDVVEKKRTADSNSAAEQYPRTDKKISNTPKKIFCCWTLNSVIINAVSLTIL